MRKEGETMATAKPFIGGNVSPEVADAIEEFYWTNRLKSKAAAIEFILRAGMAALSDKYPELDLREKPEANKKDADGLPISA